MNKLYLSSLLFLFITVICGTISAQETVLLNANEVVTGENQNACVDVSVSEFNQVVSMQWSLEWDPTVATYTGVDLGANPLGLNATAFNLFNDSTFRISWLEAMGMGVTLPAETVLISVCFDPNITEGTSTMSFEGGFMPEFIRQDFVELPFATTNGSYTVEPGVTPDPIFILPGDTNRDSIVSADDLLNIGLGFGESGPARTNPQTDFSFQSATIWDVITPFSTVDFANIDADGNGAINTIDQAVMEANFGSSIPGVIAQPVAGVTPGAFIYTQADNLESGNFGSIDIFLGDADNPVEVGYGLSFNIELDETLFDLDNFNFNFSGNFLGDDLLTFVERSATTPNVIEVSMVRTDHQNSTGAGGFIATLNILTNPLEVDMITSWNISTIRYIDKDENTFGGVSTSNEIIILAPLSTQEPAWASDLTISPNPVNNGWMTVQGLTSEVAKFSLYSMNNQLLATYPGSSNRVDVSQLPTGTYFLRFESLATSVVRKIVIQ